MAKSSWKRPCLGSREKWDLANRAADSRLRKEEADARAVDAHTILTLEQAKQTAVQTALLAREMEAAKLAQIPQMPATDEEIREMARVILEKMEELGWKRGARFAVRISEAEGIPGYAFDVVQVGKEVITTIHREDLDE